MIQNFKLGELFEIQIGKTLSEKDIVRIDDIYGRVKKKD